MKMICLVTAMFLFLVGGCASTESNWSDVRRWNNIAAYQAFIRENPNSAHVAEAHDLIEQLQAEKARRSAAALAVASKPRQLNDRAGEPVRPSPMSDSHRIVSAYESRGSNSVKIALYRQIGPDLNLVGIVEAKGRIQFDANGIVGDADALIRLRIDGDWMEITGRVVNDGRAIVTTGGGKRYSIFNLGIGPFAGQIEPVVDPQIARARTTTQPATMPAADATPAQDRQIKFSE